MFTSFNATLSYTRLTIFNLFQFFVYFYLFCIFTLLQIPPLEKIMHGKIKSGEKSEWNNYVEWEFGKLKKEIIIRMKRKFNFNAGRHIKRRKCLLFLFFFCFFYFLFQNIHHVPLVCLWLSCFKIGWSSPLPSSS